MRQGDGAPGRPACLRREVARNHLFVQARRHAAWTCVDGYWSSDNRLDEAVRKARCGAVLEPQATGVDEHDTATAPGGCAFDETADLSQDDGHRLAVRHHFEQSVFAREQRLGM